MWEELFHAYVFFKTPTRNRDFCVCCGLDQEHQEDYRMSLISTPFKVMLTNALLTMHNAVLWICRLDCMSVLLGSSVVTVKSLHLTVRTSASLQTSAEIFGNFETRLSLYRSAMSMHDRHCWTLTS